MRTAEESSVAMYDGREGGRRGWGEGGEGGDIGLALFKWRYVAMNVLSELRATLECTAEHVWQQVSKPTHVIAVAMS